ncbi:MAG: NlpC/P60 family protein [Synechococcaceae cyanobacterium]
MSYADWATARLMAAANQLIGTAYEHLHLPQFDPNLVVPSGSFQPNPATTNTTLQSTQQLLHNPPISGTLNNPYYPAYSLLNPGIDCTDFTAYIYSLALGYQMHSGTASQITFPSSSSGVGGTAEAIVLDSSGSRLTPTFFYSPNYGTTKINAGSDLDALIQAFQPGDLLYIGPPSGIHHVVMWLGAFGTNADGSPSAVPLVISSHDNTPAIFTTQNTNSDPSSPEYGFPILSSGETIETYLPPPGVQILPFTNQNWFYTNFQVAMRVLPSNDPPAVPAPAAPLGLLAIFGQRCRQLRRRLANRQATIQS